jgi:hypothetical protein
MPLKKIGPCYKFPFVIDCRLQRKYAIENGPDTEFNEDVEIFLPSFLPLGATAQGALWPPE